MERYEYAIGSTLESMQYLFELKIPAPLQTFQPYSRVVVAGNGHEIGQGWARDSWTWGFIEDANQRKALKQLCTSLSAQVYVRTYDDSIAEPAWKTYRAIMVWMPEGEDRQNDHRIGFTIRFKLLEEITEE